MKEWQGEWEREVLRDDIKKDGRRGEENWRGYGSGGWGVEGGFITWTYKLSPQCVSQLIEQYRTSCDSCGSWSQPLLSAAFTLFFF